jgi:hypothetical protein
VAAGNTEVKIGTKATITCIISNIASEDGIKVVWKEGEKTINENVETSAVKGKQQVSTLRVDNPQTDQVYTCVISSNDYVESKEFPREAHLKVFGRFIFLMSAVRNMLNFICCSLWMIDIHSYFMP